MLEPGYFPISIVHSFGKYLMSTYSVPGLGAKELHMLQKAFCLGPGKQQTNRGSLQILSQQSNHMRWPLAVSYLGVRKLEASCCCC